MSYGGFQQSTDYIQGTFSSTHQTPLTFVAWIKCSAADWSNATLSNVMGMSDDSDGDNRLAMERLGPSGGDRVGARARTTTSTAADYSFTDGTYNDTWVPVIATFANDTDRAIFIEDSGNTGSQSILKALGNILDYTILGVSPNKLNRMRGLMAEIAIFDKELSAAEIDLLQTSAENGVAPNTVAPGNCIGYWPLDTSQTNHADQSGNGGPTLTVFGSGIAFDADHPTITQEDVGEVNTRTLTDSTVVNDTPNSRHSKVRPGDVVDLFTDAIFLYTVMGRLVTDNFSLQDSLTIMKSVDKQLAELTTIEDVLISIRRIFRTVSDSIDGLTDSILHFQTCGRIGADNFLMTDVAIQQISRDKIANDSLVLTDGFQKLVTVGESSQSFIVILDDIVEIVDTQELFKSGVIVRDVSDSIAVDEFIAIALFRRRLMLDDIGMVDSSLPAKVRNRLQTESVTGIADNLADFRRRFRETVPDNVAEFSDSQEAISIRQRKLFLLFDPSGEVIIDENEIIIEDNIIVTRSAIINIVTKFDSIALFDFSFLESGTLLPIGDVCIEHGIEVQ